MVLSQISVIQRKNYDECTKNCRADNSSWILNEKPYFLSLSVLDGEDSKKQSETGTFLSISS
jgi:hypothetical protein